MVHEDPAPRSRSRDRQRVQAAAAPAPAADLRPVLHAVPGLLHAEAYSKSFVLHLDSWYAQSHPDEDFAETFAVWLNPDSDWRTRYADWPALKKLEYMDALMRDARRQADARPHAAEGRAASEPAQDARAHYERKRRHYGVEHPHFYDRDLRRLFSDSPEHAGNMKAARFIARPPRRPPDGGGAGPASISTRSIR